MSSYIIEMFGRPALGKYHQIIKLHLIGELQLEYYVETLMPYCLSVTDGKIFYGHIFIP